MQTVSGAVCDIDETEEDGWDEHCSHTTEAGLDTRRTGQIMTDLEGE